MNKPSVMFVRGSGTRVVRLVVSLFFCVCSLLVDAVGALLVDARVLLVDACVLLTGASLVDARVLLADACVLLVDARVFDAGGEVLPHIASTVFNHSLSTQHVLVDGVEWSIGG